MFAWTGTTATNFSASISTSGSLNDLTAFVVAGSASEHRRGNEIALVAFALDYMWVQADTPSQTCRVLVVWSATTLAAGDFPNSGFCGIDDIWDPHLGEVVYDKVVSFDSTITATALHRQYKCFVDLRGHRHTEYPYSNTTGSARVGNLYMWLISDSSVISHPSFSGSGQLFFRNIEY